MPAGLSDPRLATQFLRELFAAAIASAQPALCLPPHLPAAPKGRLLVVGAGEGHQTRRPARGK